MSKERELLKEIMAYMCAEYLVVTEFEMITQIEDTVKEVQELLAKPENKREPLSNEEIDILWGNENAIGLYSFARVIEKRHGIGVGNES